MSDLQKSNSLSEGCLTSSKLIIGECTSSDSDSPWEKDSASDYNEQYHPWDDTKHILENHDYCKFDELQEAFEKIETIDLDSYDERKKAILILKELPTMKLVGKNKRFPEDNSYVNLTKGMYALFVRRLIEVLECENNCTVKGQQIYNCTCKDIFLMRLNAARNLHEDLPNNLIYNYGLFTRQSFEMWHSLKWQ
ncbi:hypothetical protein M0802_010064 [Mischocyttarus mexicanus]|nr:hypothetical protein M0802_010064 [Mischocyttarus mexicanus]